MAKRKGETNKPVISKWILGFYLAIVAFLVILTVYLIYLAIFPDEELGRGFLVGSAVTGGLTIFLIFHVYKILTTRYILTNSGIEIISFYGVKKIPYKEIQGMKKTLIPFGFRLFGSSFYGGYYYIPGLGRAFVAMTNFNDGIIIAGAKGPVIITPRNPEQFMKGIREKAKK